MQLNVNVDVTLNTTEEERMNGDLKFCVSESALARMRSYEGKKIISPSRGFEV